MTVITYSSAAGRLPKEIQVLEHPLASGNVPEPLSEVLDPRTMLDPSENPILDSCGVKGQRWIEQRDNERRGKVRRKRQRWGRWVNRESQWCNLRNKCNKEVRKDLKSGRECAEGRHKSRTDVFGILSAAETEGKIEQREERMEKRKTWPVFPRPFHLKHITEGEVKREKNMMMRWHHIFLWLILLLFSLCPKPASSQVRGAVKSQFKSLIQRLWNNHC